MSKKPIDFRSMDLKDVHLLKDEDIMNLFRISRSCLYRWNKQKLLPCLRFSGTNYYIEAIIIKMLYLRGGTLPEDLEDTE